MHYEYKTKGTCSQMIFFDVEDGKVHNVQFLGGCNGNLKGIGALVEGMRVEEVISRVEGIRCGMKSTSCPDQLATALEQATGMHFTLVHYSEHALDTDTDSRACCYVGLKWASGKETWGCGTHTDIIVAGVRALVSAINNK